MPIDLTERTRVHDAVYWPRTGFTATSRPVYGSPVQLKVWWKQQQEEMVTDGATRWVSNAMLFVGQDVNRGDRFKKGVLADLVPGKAADQQPESYEVRKFDSITRPSDLAVLRRAYL